MARPCSTENCTVSETNTCLLGLDAETCPHRTPEQQSDSSLNSGLMDPLPPPASSSKLPNSLTLGLDNAQTLMSNRYCTVVGILGAPDAGKTASIVSLYLLLARARLTGFRFADSKTLMALDEISRTARHWSGDIPDQLTLHTELSDVRSAGFLHLKLLKLESDQHMDLLIPDLPGEWSTDFIESGRTDRLQFLHRADVIWIMVDGIQLSTPKSKQLALHRTKLLLQRISAFLAPSPQIILVVTRKDQATPKQEVVAELLDEAKALGLAMRTISIASFAAPGDVKAGEGIPELIEASLLPTTAPAGVDMDDVVGNRWILRYK